MTWEASSGTDEARLRYLLDGIEGFRGSVDIWDFSARSNLPASAFATWTNAGINYAWTWFGSTAFWNAAAAYACPAGAVAGGTTLILAGLAANQPAVVQGGYVQAGRRLYLAAASATADGSGVVTITLSTPLVASVGAGALVRLQQAGCEMRLVSQAWAADRDAENPFYSVTAQFLETVEDYS